jgi:Zn-dependent protease
MLRFRLFGYDIDVQFFFLLSAVFLAGGMQPPFDLPLILVKVVMVFIAVLSHELGHAFAMTHYKLEPSITLAGFGGFTTPSVRSPLTRPQSIFISLAGPLAGFVQAGMLYALLNYLPPALVLRTPPLVIAGLHFLFVIDIIWSIFNLIPCLPLDGGHVLAHALGPQRARLAVMISLGVAVLAGAGLALLGEWYAVIFFALFAFQNYQRLQLTPPDGASRGPRVERAPVEMPGEASALLQSARHALGQDQFDRALTLARRALEGDEGTFVPTPMVRLKAFEVVAWTKLQQEDLPGATDALTEARRAGEPDAALVGALALAKGNTAEARRVLEAARGKGDDRREIVGPLVQALLAENEVARAAAVALEIVDQLSDDDVRKMAGIAFSASAFEWSGRLSEALFARTRLGDDAYEAARGFAKDGDVERATDMLRRAVDAGFSDRARAWSDAALEALRARSLDDVLPRP